ncbi:hypothetical protein XF24_00987 [candidate division SR1 bacterium Aalborg_AAW-1]|nr:hypothetical protein XF24_00987 [candidate division SR1 bacterium Aalborg_AAW-1]
MLISSLLSIKYNHYQYTTIYQKTQQLPTISQKKDLTS